VKLADDTPAEEHIGGRDLTRWPTPVGRGLVRVVAVLAANISAHSVLYITASVGLALVIGLTAAGAGIYDAVVDPTGSPASTNQPWTSPSPTAPASTPSS
jgi:undecaprenyl-diphosphatase